MRGRTNSLDAILVPSFRWVCCREVPQRDSNPREVPFSCVKLPCRAWRSKAGGAYSTWFQ